MSDTPSDSDHDRNYINGRALEGLMRSFDRAIDGKYGLSSAGQQANDPPPESKLREFELQVVKTVMARERAVEQEQQEQAHRPSFWYTFPPLKAIRRFRDNIRLRRYNRELIKNNVH